MPKKIFYRALAFVLSALWSMPQELVAMSASEILEQVRKTHFGQTFRVAIGVKTFKGKREVSSHSLWFVSQTQGEVTSIFVDFDEPPESKGLRFLFHLTPEKPPVTYMYMPSADKTVPLAMDEESADIGATGLTTADIQAFVPQAGQQEILAKEEDVDGRPCYVMKVILPGNKGEGTLWISKKDYNIVKSQEVDRGGKVTRSFRVLEFFKTENGREYPRVEEITVPAKNMRIEVRLEHALFGIQVAPELMDQKTFGKYPWKTEAGGR